MANAMAVAEHTDIVISHQWENPLNYFYLEACWQGYPLVHNAALCADLGLYYEKNDLAAGCARVLEAIDSHDAQAQAWRDRQRRLIARYLPGDARVTEVYDALLGELVNRSPK